MGRLRSTDELNRAGFDASELRRLTRDGRLERVRRGVYAEPEPTADPAAAHRRLVAATVPHCGQDVVVSHVSAAVLHGLPVQPERLTQVHVTRDQAGGGRSRGGLHVHGLDLGEKEVVRIGGMPVTTVARTVLDLACTLPLNEAVAAGDAALRTGCSARSIHDALDRVGRRAGIRAARRAVSLLDGRSESPAESWSRVLLAEHGVPAPVPQLEVFDGLGELVGRADFGWPEQRTLGEFDGKVKYGRTLHAGGDLEEVLWYEKQREDALRACGWEVVRWVWADLWQPEAWLERLARAFARGSATRHVLAAG